MNKIGISISHSHDDQSFEEIASFVDQVRNTFNKPDSEIVMEKNWELSDHEDVYFEISNDMKDHTNKFTKEEMQILDAIKRKWAI